MPSAKAVENLPTQIFFQRDRRFLRSVNAVDVAFAFRFA